MTVHDCTIRELIDTTVGIPADELPLVLTDPDSGESLHPQRASAPESVEKAIAFSWSAHENGVWADLPREARAAALRNLSAELVLRAEELSRADSLDNGVPQSTNFAFISALATSWMGLAVGQIEESFGHVEQTSVVGTCDQWRLPWGPAAVFLPLERPVAPRDREDDRRTGGRVPGRHQAVGVGTTLLRSVC